MKKYLPFVFPAIAVLLVLFLAVRWFSLRSSRPEVGDQFGQNMDIQNITGQSMTEVTGIGGYETVELEAADPTQPTMGEIRYDMTDDGKVQMTVMGALPELTTGQYQVWFKQVDGDGMRKAFVLEQNKGGYLGSAAVSADVLPVEVIVSKEMSDDETMETVILRGVLTAPDAEAVSN